MSTQTSTNFALAILLATTSAACGGGYPEGRYPCTTAPECPPDWFCHSDRLCYSTPEADAGLPDAQVDAARSDAADAYTPDAEPVDAPLPDAGAVDAGIDGNVCIPAAEACNGADDDCDLRVDEMLAEVGSPVVFETSSMATSPQILALAGNFSVVYQLGGQLRMRQIALGGTPIGSVLALGTASGPPQGHSARFDGTTVLVTYNATAGTTFFGIGPTGGTDLISRTLLASSGTTPLTRAFVTDAAPARATVYIEELSGSRSQVTRFRLDTSSGTAATIRSSSVTTDLGYPTIWAAISTPTDDYAVHVNGLGAVVLSRGAGGDGARFTVAGTLRPAGGSDVENVGVALVDHTSPLSEANPLAVVWQTVDGVEFIEVTSISPLTASAAHALTSGGAGPTYSYDAPTFLSVVAAPSSGSGLPSWYAAAAERRDATLSGRGVVAVWEVAAGGGTDRALSVPTNAETYIRDVSMAVIGDDVLFASTSSLGLVTRRIGCR